MRLSEMIRLMRGKAPSNTADMAKSFESASRPQFPTSQQKSINKSTAKEMERQQHPSPYIGQSETLTLPNPDEQNPALREHIKNYRKHATRPDMGSLNKRSYV